MISDVNNFLRSIHLFNKLQVFFPFWHFLIDFLEKGPDKTFLNLIHNRLHKHQRISTKNILHLNMGETNRLIINYSITCGNDEMRSLFGKMANNYFRNFFILKHYLKTAVVKEEKCLLICTKLRPNCLLLNPVEREQIVVPIRITKHFKGRWAFLIITQQGSSMKSLQRSILLISQFSI